MALPPEFKKPRGRRRCAWEIADRNAAELKWARGYTERLLALGNDPAAWLLNFSVRDVWLWRWELCVSEWKMNSSLYPQFPEYSYKDELDEFAKNPKDYLDRLFGVIKHNLVVTRPSMAEGGFGIRDLGEMVSVFHRALDEFQGTLPAVVELAGPDAHYLRIDSRYADFRIRKDMSPRLRGSEIRRWLGDKEKPAWQIDFDVLRGYGVLQWIDLRIFELLNNCCVTNDTKADIVFEGVRKQIPGFRFRHKSKGEFTWRDLETTQEMAEQHLALMSGDNGPLTELCDEATARIIRVWRVTKENGDRDCVFPMSEIREMVWWT